MNKRGFLQKNWRQTDAERARRSLAAWYNSHARDLPWRLTPSLYGTWLSEIMLQQTRVDTGIPKWHLFQELFPTVNDLAQASEAEVMKAWEGLGYYRRARLLHKAAKVIASQGRFPNNREGWLALPGVGPYTSAAIASIGLGEPVAAVDGNVQRVMSRWAGVTAPVDSKPGAQIIQEVADDWLDPDRPGDHNQAVMELGALVCSPKHPRCIECPARSTCASADSPDMWSVLPNKTPKRKAARWELAWHVAHHGNQVVAIQRPDTGVWATLWAFPEQAPTSPTAPSRTLIPEVVHVLTHKRIHARMEGTAMSSAEALHAWAKEVNGVVMTWEECEAKAWPRLATKVWPQLKAACMAHN
jgi:A/G-specific adenine glycosylase